MQIEHLILRHLIGDEEFTKKTLPFIKDVYFEEPNHQILLRHIRAFVDEYAANPTDAALRVTLSKDPQITDETLEELERLMGELNEIPIHTGPQFKWLVEESEKYCQDRAIFLAVHDSINALSEQGTPRKHTIPKVLQEALSVGFDTRIGHDYILDGVARYDFLHKVENRIPFDIEYLNKITRGGLSRKTLSVIMAGTNVGKSLALCHIAGAAMMQGFNVLYITLEMAEEKIAGRIDANLFDVNLEDLQELTRMQYLKKLQQLNERQKLGKLLIKEYPTSSAHVGHFRHIIHECRIKYGFAPDLVVVDYLNLCASARFKAASQGQNSYAYIKSIAEEMRGLSVEENVAILSATQFNREGYGSSDPGLEQTSESFGLPATADLMLAMIATDELNKLGHVMFKQLKNRDSDVTKYQYFVVGMNRSKMRLFDVDDKHTQSLVDNLTKPAAGKQQTPPPASFSGKSKQKFAPSGIQNIGGGDDD